MHLQDHAVEAKLKPVQELKRSDALRLREGPREFSDAVKKRARRGAKSNLADKR